MAGTSVVAVGMEANGGQGGSQLEMELTGKKIMKVGAGEGRCP